MNSGNSNSLLILVGMLVFADYERAVIEDYKIRKEKGDLALVLLNPTPSTLRDECVAVCQHRYDRRDERALRSFFGKGTDQKTFLEVMSDFPTDKFKPLVNYLRGETKSPETKNVELLAWLSDFQPRPSDRYKSSKEVSVPPRENLQENSNKKVGNEVLSVKDDKIKDEPAPESSEPTKRSFNFNLGKGVVVIALLAVIIIGIRFCTGRPNKSYSPKLDGSGACMFWDGDHYQETPCIPKLGDTSVIALDPGKLNHFRMITRPDTITEESAGKVWYVKYNKNVEFYTADGFHPIDQRLRLRPATRFMINKYCHPNQ